MSKLRKSAKDQPCLMQIPGVCSHDPARTVLCHIRRPWNAGVALKPSDLHSFFACDCCHDTFDGRRNSDLNKATLDSLALDAHLRTLSIWQAMGLI